MFFTVLYRSHSFHYTSPEFLTFLLNFENLYSKIKAENPLAMFLQEILMHIRNYGGPMVIQITKAQKLKNFSLNSVYLRVISEPTNFEPNKTPSCIDLIVTDQPNIILDSGTRASLDSNCHHQIIFCKVNFKIHPPLPFERKIWHYNKANSAAIKRSITNEHDVNILR